MTGVWLALLASVAWSVADFLGGLTARGHSVFTVLAVSQPAGLVLITIAVLLHGDGLALNSSSLWAVGAGIASVGSLGCLYYSMSRGDMILVAPLAATGVVIPVAAGIAGGNAVTAVTTSGMLLAVAGAIATTWSAPESAGQRGSSGNLVAVVFALGSATGQGLFLLMLSRATHGDPYSATWIMRVTSCAVTLVAYFGGRRLLAPTESTPADAIAVAVSAGRSATEPGSTMVRTWPDGQQQVRSASTASRRWLWTLALLAMPAVGLADALAEISFAGATTSGTLSIAAVLSSLYPVGTMFLAVLFLRERARPVQGLGAVCALVGVLLLSSA